MADLAAQSARVCSASVSRVNIGKSKPDWKAKTTQGDCSPFATAIITCIYRPIDLDHRASARSRHKIPGQ